VSHVEKLSRDEVRRRIGLAPTDNQRSAKTWRDGLITARELQTKQFKSVRIILPALIPALLSGAGLAFARAVGEFGSVVLIGGGIPRETEVASQYIAGQIEIDRQASAAAVSVALLLIAFAVLFVLRRAAR